MHWIKIIAAVTSVSLWSWVIGEQLDKHPGQSFEQRFYMVQFGAY